jgi:hypothetical protein
MNESRKIALRGIGSDSRTRALRGFFLPIIANTSVIIKRIGAKLPQYMLPSGGAKFNRK